MVNYYTARLVYKDHLRDQRHVFPIRRWSLYVCSITWKVNVETYKCGLYKQVVSREGLTVFCIFPYRLPLAIWDVSVWTVMVRSGWTEPRCWSGPVTHTGLSATSSALKVPRNWFSKTRSARWSPWTNIYPSCLTNIQREFTVYSFYCGKIRWSLHFKAVRSARKM